MTFTFIEIIAHLAGPSHVPRARGLRERLLRMAVSFRSARATANRQLLDDVRRSMPAIMAVTVRLAYMPLCERKADRRAAAVWSV